MSTEHESSSLARDTAGTRRQPAASPIRDTPRDLLFHVEFNRNTARDTIVLLHGLLSSHLEWAHVIPHLADTYHVVAVDLPGHSRSRSAATTAEEAHPARSAGLVAALIRARAHGGAAHVVGLSMGGFVALELARRFPAACRSVFVSGAAPFAGLDRLLAERPVAVLCIMRVMLSPWIPASLYWALAEWSGLKRHEELLEEMRANVDAEVVAGVYAGILDFGWEQVAELGGSGVRVLTVAGGRRDNVPGTKRMGEELRRAGGEGCRAAVVRSALHAWDLQFPELFARGIRAWIEDAALPEEFEELV